MTDPAAKLDPAARRAASWPPSSSRRWADGGERLPHSRSAVAAAKGVAAADPATAWLILAAVAQLGPANQADAGFRHDLLERAVAANPSNVEWASRLAVDCESRGELERCEKLLSPLRARLGESEGARVLAALDARANRFDQAIRLLRDYSKNRLTGSSTRMSGFSRSIPSFRRRLSRSLKVSELPISIMIGTAGQVRVAASRS